jgi:uncharacterized protein YacL
VIIEQWEVVKFNYVIVFILSGYITLSSIYLYFNFKKNNIKKSLIHFIIGAIITLSTSFIISKYSTKTVHIIYQYNNEKEVLYLVDMGWSVIEHSRDYQRVHFSKLYKTGNTKMHDPNNGGYK